jgi:hypothetical protein
MDQIRAKTMILQTVYYSGNSINRSNYFRILNKSKIGKFNPLRTAGGIIEKDGVSLAK